MSDDAWLTHGPMRGLVDSLATAAAARYRIESPEAELLIREALSADEALRRVAERETEPERIERTRVFRKAASAARRRVYYHLRRYAADEAGLRSLVARLESLGPDAVDERETLARRIAAAHRSTAERLPSLEEFHRRLFSALGEVHGVLDVGCGVSPLVFPWDGDGRSVTRYIAADRNATAVAAVGAYGKARGDGHIVPVVWDIKTGWEELLRHAGPEPLDVALLLKIVPILHRQDRPSLGILAKTPARTWVVSGSRTSMTRRASIERRERAIVKRFVDRSGRRVRTEFSAGEEFVWVVD